RRRHGPRVDPAPDRLPEEREGRVAPLGLRVAVVPNGGASPVSSQTTPSPCPAMASPRRRRTPPQARTRQRAVPSSLASGLGGRDARWARRLDASGASPPYSDAGGAVGARSRAIREPLAAGGRAGRAVPRGRADRRHPPPTRRLHVLREALPAEGRPHPTEAGPEAASAPHPRRPQVPDAPDLRRIRRCLEL